MKSASYNMLKKSRGVNSTNS